MRLSARSSLPRSAHLALHEAKTSFSSRGKMLKQVQEFISRVRGARQNPAACPRPSARSGDNSIWKTTGPYTSEDEESLNLLLFTGNKSQCVPLYFDVTVIRKYNQIHQKLFVYCFRRQTHHSELIILQSNSSQHMRRFAWWSARTDGGTRIGSTSQFSSDSYKARMKSPAHHVFLKIHLFYKTSYYSVLNTD